MANSLRFSTPVFRPCQAPCKRRRLDKRGLNATRGEANDPGFQNKSSLTATLKRKRQQLTEVLQDYTQEDVFNRLGIEDLQTQQPDNIQHRFTGLIPEVRFKEGRPVIVVEVAKPTPSWTSGDLAELAQEFERQGADALAVPTDAADTSTGLADLLAVCRAVKCPVIRRDWILHPLQIREAKEAGAAGVMGLITSVLGKNTAIYSSYAASIGLDCPVEIVNTEELKFMEKYGVPFFGCNIGVGLSLAIPGFRADIATGLLSKLEFGTSSIVGVTSSEEAVKAREAGADMILVKKEWICAALANATPLPLQEEPQAAGQRIRQPSIERLGESRQQGYTAAVQAFLQQLKYTVSGDD